VPRFLQFPSPAIRVPTAVPGVGDGQGSHNEASVVSGIGVPPDDLDHGVGQALGEGKDVGSNEKHLETVLRIGMTGRFGHAAIGSARGARGGASGKASRRGQTRRRQKANPCGQDRDHPGTSRASGCRGDCTGLTQLRCARIRGGPMRVTDIGISVYVDVSDAPKAVTRTYAGVCDGSGLRTLAWARMSMCPLYSQCICLVGLLWKKRRFVTVRGGI
jgi:hypothetical protein